nr:hypothetical protein [Paenibacillus harenae]
MRKLAERRGRQVHPSFERLAEMRDVPVAEPVGYIPGRRFRVDQQQFGLP